MNVVEQAARIIDPDAFAENEWYDVTTGKPADFGELEEARKKFHQSQAVWRAIEVLKLAIASPNLRRRLIDDETARWRELGIPKAVLENPQAKKILAGKFGSKRITKWIPA